MKMVALIPARAGSKRCPGKNTRQLAGHPLIAYTIAAAQESGVFERVVVSTDDDATGALAIRSGAYYLPRWAKVTDEQLDIVWVREALTHFVSVSESFNAFAILRPTSPFRTADTIRRAQKQFYRDEVHSLRAMQPVKEHPGKMWQVAHEGYPAVPLIGRAWPAPMMYWEQLQTSDDQPWHSQPTQRLPKVYVQNASLEMAWSYVIPAFDTISGRKVAPFFTEGYEGFDVNTESDFAEAERIAAAHPELLPRIHAHR